MKKKKKKKIEKLLGKKRKIDEAEKKFVCGTGRNVSTSIANRIK